MATRANRPSSLTPRTAAVALTVIVACLLAFAVVGLLPRTVEPVVVDAADPSTRGVATYGSTVVFDSGATGRVDSPTPAHDQTAGDVVTVMVTITNTTDRALPLAGVDVACSSSCQRVYSSALGAMQQVGDVPVGATHTFVAAVTTYGNVIPDVALQANSVRDRAVVFTAN